MDLSKMQFMAKKLVSVNLEMSLVRAAMMRAKSLYLSRSAYISSLIRADLAGAKTHQPAVKP
jgi:metal-responsive CopG/Arc/MetJ family transcriptional regulator